MCEGKGKEMPTNARLKEMEAAFPIQLIPLLENEQHERHFIVMALRDNVARSNGEFAISVDPKTLEIDPDLVEEAKQFCQKYGLPEFKPEWLLFS